MAKSNITSANAVIQITVDSLFPTAQTLQGFAADDIFTAASADVAEFLMGVDGKLSGGFVFNPRTFDITFQADSTSIAVFDTWATSQQAVKSLYWCQMTVLLPGTGTLYTCTNGGLKSYTVMPDAKKVLQPRKFSLVFESITPSQASQGGALS